MPVDVPGSAQSGMMNLTADVALTARDYRASPVRGCVPIHFEVPRFIPVNDTGAMAV
jgi:hypothetical protein